MKNESTMIIVTKCIRRCGFALAVAMLLAASACSSGENEISSSGQANTGCSNGENEVSNSGQAGTGCSNGENEVSNNGQAGTGRPEGDDSCQGEAAKGNDSLQSFIEQGSSFLWIGAHPDDESVYCSCLFADILEHDGSISIISLTSGMYGKDHADNGDTPITDPELLANARESELKEVAKLLNAKCILPRWDKDMGVKNIDIGIIRIQEFIIENQPDVVITHAPKGGYGHIEHVLTSRIVKAAFMNLDESHRPKALYYALHGYPDPPSVDLEIPTDVISGQGFSKRFNLSYWGVTLLLLEKHKTQKFAYEAALKVKPKYQKNLFHRVEFP